MDGLLPLVPRLGGDPLQHQGDPCDPRLAGDRRHLRPYEVDSGVEVDDAVEAPRVDLIDTTHRHLVEHEPEQPRPSASVFLAVGAVVGPRAVHLDPAVFPIPILFKGVGLDDLLLVAHRRLAVPDADEGRRAPIALERLLEIDALVLDGDDDVERLRVLAVDRDDLGKSVDHEVVALLRVLRPPLRLQSAPQVDLPDPGEPPDIRQPFDGCERLHHILLSIGAATAPSPPRGRRRLRRLRRARAARSHFRPSRTCASPPSPAGSRRARALRTPRPHRRPSSA